MPVRAVPANTTLEALVCGVPVRVAEADSLVLGANVALTSTANL